MRTLHAILVLIVSLVLLTAQVQAKEPQVRSGDETSASRPCHSLEKGPDGAWIEIPCQELGSPAAVRPKPENRNSQHASH